MTTVVYEDYEKMIYNFAWSYSRKTGVPFDDLRSEGNLIFVKCTQTWDEKRSDFSTFLWRCLRNGLWHHVRKNRPFILDQENLLENNECPKHGQRPDIAFAVKEKMALLPDDCKIIIQMIQDNPHYYLGFNKREAKSKIKTELRTKHQWSFPRIWNAMRVLSMAYA